jgi:hypothetical protein
MGVKYTISHMTLRGILGISTIVASRNFCYRCYEEVFEEKLDFFEKKIPRNFFAQISTAGWKPIKLAEAGRSKSCGQREREQRGE